MSDVRYPDIHTLKQLNAAVLAQAQDSLLLDAVRQNVDALYDLLAESYSFLRAQNLSASMTLGNLLANAGECKEILEQEAVYTAQQLKTKSADIGAQLRRIQNYKTTDLDETIKRQQSALADAQVAFDQNAALIAQYQEQIHSLDTVIAAFEHPSVSKYLKRGLIPSASEVDLIFSQIKSPTLDPVMVKAALSKLNENFDLATAGLKVSELMKNRSQVSSTLHKIEATQERLRASMQVDSNKLAAIQACGGVAQLREQWLAQGAAFKESWDQLLAPLESAFADSVQAATAMLEYMIKVRRAFEDA